MDNLLEPNRLAQLMEQIRSANSSGFWMKQAASLIVEQMLNAEVDEHLGRMRYQCIDDQQVGEGKPFTGYRNGFKSRRLKTAEGRIDVEVPQVRDHPDGPFRSTIWTALGKKSPALQRLACEMYARGLSTRDIEDLLAELCESQGDLDQTLLSKSAVSQVIVCFKDDLEATLAHLKLPSLHQKMIRTTNLSERSFVEERRRAKVIPRFFDEKGCLKLVFATLWRASQRWRKVRFTTIEKRQLEAYIRLRRAMGKNVRTLAA